MASTIKKRRKVSYAKWGYIFILPFFVTFAIFSLIPLVQSFIYSFNLYVDGVSTGFCGFRNYEFLFKTCNEMKTLGSTLLMWIMGFIPQLLVSLLLAVWFTDSRLKIKGAGFFKAIIYMPNLIMATAMSSIVASMFSLGGPFYALATNKAGTFDIFANFWATKWLVAGTNFIMWFGNTTILLMAGVMGIDESIFEAAIVDGAGPVRTFKDITMPLLWPIFIYVFLTSFIGGIQMFDIPATIVPGVIGSTQVITLIIDLNSYLGQGGTTNYGAAGALTVFLFLMTLVLSLVAFKTINKTEDIKKKKKAKKVTANV